MKKLLTYCGILASFVFLLVINTDVLSGKGCFDCPPELTWEDFANCYYHDSQSLDALCIEMDINTRMCTQDDLNQECSEEWTLICCDMDSLCTRIKREEGNDEAFRENPQRN